MDVVLVLVPTVGVLVKDLVRKKNKVDGLVGGLVLLLYEMAS